MASSENLFVRLKSGEHEGIGELSPATGSAWTAERGEGQLEAFWAGYAGRGEPARRVGRDAGGGAWTRPRWRRSTSRCGTFWRGARGCRCTGCWGSPRRSVPTSVTIGINPPEVTRERVPDILRRTGARLLKIKLGSPEGLDHDRAHFLAAAEASAPFGAGLRVDANGGWSPEGAREMMAWLAGRGVAYVEQPLAEGREDDLPSIFEGRPLPIYADESCRFARDVPRLRGRVDGVNLKLMKAGGLTEGLRLVAAARAYGLRTMIGCMSESSVAIAAGASIAALFDAVDLDSHLNLAPDPADGAPIVGGVVLPAERPGHGGRLLGESP